MARQVHLRGSRRKVAIRMIHPERNAANSVSRLRTADLRKLYPLHPAAPLAQWGDMNLSTILPSPHARRCRRNAIRPAFRPRYGTGSRSDVPVTGGQ